MYQLYGFLPSGNCYKVRLLLEHLDLAYTWHEVDILKGESRTEDFLEKRPVGKVPLLELDDGRALGESNAILLHLGEDTDYLPKDAWDRAKVYEWLFFEQYQHEPAVAVARFIVQHLSADHPRHAEVPGLLDKGRDALKVMENQLQRTRFLVGDNYTIADIALYAYTHVAPEAGFELKDYPAIVEWMRRVALQPGYIAMTKPTKTE